MATSILPQYPIWSEIDGSPLEDGYIYIGIAGLNAESNPQTVYFDGALSVTAAQPIRTLNGYPARSGSPAMMYVAGDFSIVVRDKAGVLIYASLFNTYTDNFGTMANQNANAVAITGGTITGLSTPLPIGSGGTGGATQSAARTALGLGTIATQDASAVAVTGGTINGTSIGATTPAAGTFTDLTGKARLSTETTGTLTVVSANRIIQASGGITLPSGVFAAGDIIMIDGNGTNRTITRGTGLTMNFSGVDTATVTLAGTGTMGIYFRSATVCIVTGAIS
jgi:hypothetical protein